MDLCQICQRRPAVVWDHDHKTGIIRGRLCSLCNTALGGFEDDAESLRRAIEYLAAEPLGHDWASFTRERQRLAMREWRARNRERDAANRRAWLSIPENRERQREAVRRSRRHPDRKARAAERERAWRLAHPEKLAEYKANRRRKRLGGSSDQPPLN